MVLFGYFFWGFWMVFVSVWFGAVSVFVFLKVFVDLLVFGWAVVVIF